MHQVWHIKSSAFETNKVTPQSKFQCRPLKLNSSVDPN